MIKLKDKSRTNREQNKDKNNMNKEEQYNSEIYEEKVKREKKRQHNKTLKQFKKNQKQFILTSRFSIETWNENKHYLQTIKAKVHNIHCIYCTPYIVARCIPPSSIMYILEMNNDKNRIMGIGMVRNKYQKPYKYSIYTNQIYNRFNYVGRYHISRSEMNVEENILMCYFDNVCFKGNSHMKRGRGITMFPMDTIYHLKTTNNIYLVEYIKNMFKRRFIDTTNPHPISNT